MPSDAPPVKESNARHALNAVQTDQDFSRTDLEAIKDLVPHFGEDEANKIIRDYTGVDMAQPATPPAPPPRPNLSGSNRVSKTRGTENEGRGDTSTNGHGAK